MKCGAESQASPRMLGTGTDFSLPSEKLTGPVVGRALWACSGYHH